LHFVCVGRYQSSVADKKHFTVQKYELLTEYDGPELAHKATHSTQSRGVRRILQRHFATIENFCQHSGQSKLSCR
jgi:hypothetical protein